MNWRLVRYVPLAQSQLGSNPAPCDHDKNKQLLKTDGWIHIKSIPPAEWPFIWSITYDIIVVLLLTTVGIDVLAGKQYFNAEVWSNLNALYTAG